MNLKTIASENQAPIKGVRVIFERENDVLTRVYLSSEAGDTYCIKLGAAGGLEVLRRTPDQIARSVECDEAATSLAVPANQ